MSNKPEDKMLIAFARAASKAQEVEELFREMLIAAEVANDTKDRSFEDIAAEMEKPPGVLKARYLEIVKPYLDDPQFTAKAREFFQVVIDYRKRTRP